FFHSIIFNDIVVISVKAANLGRWLSRRVSRHGDDNVHRRVSLFPNGLPLHGNQDLFCPNTFYSMLGIMIAMLIGKRQ
ncbi:MAG: hypothetical protein KKD63_06225, partial [Proteobacteria bacterium]|nr:hypothetical protein [Pseudomonadota bacterium]